jgi:hypothetical protein
MSINKKRTTEEENREKRSEWTDTIAFVQNIMDNQNVSFETKNLRLKKNGYFL